VNFLAWGSWFAVKFIVQVVQVSVTANFTVFFNLVSCKVQVLQATTQCAAAASAASPFFFEGKFSTRKFNSKTNAA
jgi:hypothetical protein